MKHNFAFMLNQTNIQLSSTAADIMTTIEMVDQAMKANFKSQEHPGIWKLHNLNRELYQWRRRQQGKRHLKIITCAIVTICDCPIMFAFYNVGKESYNWTGVRAVDVNTEN